VHALLYVTLRRKISVLFLFFLYFLGVRETGWFEVSETRNADITNVGTVPVLLVPKPYHITP
jgi:hypothetical protein